MKRALWVFRKETREMFRDKRVRTGAFIMPVFMIIMFVELFGMINEKVSKPQKQNFAIVGHVQDQASDMLLKTVAGKLVTVNSVADGVKMLQKGDVKLVIEVKSDLDSKGLAKQVQLTATYDPTEPLSQIALATLREPIEAINKEGLKRILKENGVPESASEPIKFESKEAEKPKGLGGSSMVSLLPYLIVIWAFYGGFSIVSDLVAGEKERGTMETLLVSPIKRSEAAMGKYLALVLVCFLSSMMSLVAILAVGALRIGNTAGLFPTGMSISLSGIAAMFLALVPLVLFFAGILMSVSAVAKNMREAQTYLTLVSFVVVMPAVFSQFLGFTGMQNAAWVKWTPVLGNAVCLKEALLGKTDWPGLMSSVTLCTLLAAVLLVVTIRLFNRETILSRS